ncbi:MAG: hypothetical protein HY916_09160 [Desulfovibrio sp.]|nr:hypothetical protein [Desulfovibrio sp.]
MGKLVNMALPKPKKGEKDKCGELCTNAADAPKYPWGLTLRLDDEAIKKLGLDIKNFNTDTVVTITAKAECTEMREEDRQSSGKSQSLSFQITDMAISREGKDAFADGWDAAGKGKPEATKKPAEK